MERNVLGTRQSGLPPPLRVASLFNPRHLELAGQAHPRPVLVADDPTLAGRAELLREQWAFNAPDAEGDAA